MKTILFVALFLPAFACAELKAPDGRSPDGFGMTLGGDTILGTTTVHGPLDVKDGGTIHNGLFIGNNGTKISKAFAADVSLDFGVIAAGACQTLTMTVTNASNGDVVAIGPPQALASADTNFVFSYFAQADIVNVRLCCMRLTGSCANPPAATVEALVIRAK